MLSSPVEIGTRPSRRAGRETIGGIWSADAVAMAATLRQRTGRTRSPKRSQPGNSGREQQETAGVLNIARNGLRRKRECQKPAGCAGRGINGQAVGSVKDTEAQGSEFGSPAVVAGCPAQVAADGAESQKRTDKPAIHKKRENEGNYIPIYPRPIDRAGSPPAHWVAAQMMSIPMPITAMTNKNTVEMTVRQPSRPRSGRRGWRKKGRRRLTVSGAGFRRLGRRR